MKVLVLGGTGVISRGITNELLAGDHTVTVFNRGTKNVAFSGEVESIVGDRKDAEGFARALKGREFDAVIDMISFDAEDAEATLAVLGERTGHLIFCSSVAAYKRPYRTVPTAEDAEELTSDPVFPYAFKKAEMERYLRTVIDTRRLPITVVRPSLTYGQGSANIGVLRQNYGIVERIRSGKPLVMFGDGTTPWSFTFVPDLARGFVELLGKKETFGRAYHITSEERRLWRDLYLELGAILGREPRLVYIPSSALNRAAPDLFAHLYYEKTYSGLFSNAKIRSVAPRFSARISLREGLEGILAWWEREARTVDSAKDALEDRLAAAADEFEAKLVSAQPALT